MQLPRLRGGTLTLLGYPLVMVHAEKIVTMLERGETNTRWRDFGDVLLLASSHSVDGDALSIAMRTVAGHRGAALQPLAPLIPSYGEAAQRKWAAWMRKQRLDDRLPTTFRQALSEVVTFADPALAGEVSGRTWDPVERSWV